MNFIDPKLSAYCEKHSTPEPEVLHEIFRQTHLRHLNPRMLSGHLQGLFLKMLTQMIQPECILEIGTFTGYSAISMAMALPENGHLHTIESDEELKTEIIQNFNRSGVQHKITLHIGNALEILPELLSQQTFDMVFMDADKEHYTAYYHLLKDNLQAGAMLITDNVLWNGKVLDEEDLINDRDTSAIDSFNRLLRTDPTFETLMLPFRDGISIARKLP